MRDVLVRAVQCEALNRRLYRELAEAFAAEPLVSELWRELADDEQLHVALLSNLREQLPAEALAGPAPPRLEGAVAALETILSGKPLARVESLEDAYQLAHELESQELLGAFQLVATTLLPDALRDEYLTVQIDDHLEKLPAFGQVYPDYRRRAIRGAGGLARDRKGS